MKFVMVGVINTIVGTIIMFVFYNIFQLLGFISIQLLFWQHLQLYPQQAYYVSLSRKRNIVTDALYSQYHRVLRTGLWHRQTSDAIHTC